MQAEDVNVIADRQLIQPHQFRRILCNRKIETSRRFQRPRRQRACLSRLRFDASEQIPQVMASMRELLANYAIESM